MSRTETRTGTLHLAETSRADGPGAEGVIVLAQAGGQITTAPAVPGNIALTPLPPRCRT